jgi:hypothetical protein
MTTLFGTANLGIGMKQNVSRMRLFDGPLDLSWHHCATTSDFIAEIFAVRFQTSPDAYKEARHSIGYLVNELIENAVKFRAHGEILIEASADMNSFLLKVSNDLDTDAAAEFKRLLSEITEGDPGELLIKRIEANAEKSDMSGSGLGLLTLMSDYNARLAWVFSQPEGHNRVCLEVFASLPITRTYN